MGQPLAWLGNMMGSAPVRSVTEMPDMRKLPAVAAIIGLSLLVMSPAGAFSFTQGVGHATVGPGGSVDPRSVKGLGEGATLPVTPPSLHLAQAVPATPPEMEVLGEVTATFEGVARSWLTFLVPSAEGHSEQATARWGGLDAGHLPEAPDMAEAFGIDPDTLSEEERAHFERLLAEMGARQSAMREALAQDVGLSIQAHDPENPQLFTEGVLTLTPLGMNRPAQAWMDEAGTPLPAEIMYVEASAGGLPSVIYTSNLDGEGDGEILFETLSLEAPFGMASGSFSGTLCRVEMGRGRIATDAEDCRPISGRFDTELFAGPR